MEEEANAQTKEEEAKDEVMEELFYKKWADLLFYYLNFEPNRLVRGDGSVTFWFGSGTQFYLT